MVTVDVGSCGRFRVREWLSTVKNGGGDAIMEIYNRCALIRYMYEGAQW